jgi:hypothetical protein
MTDEQLQKLIDHKVQEATEPLERRWESLRRIIAAWKLRSDDWGEEIPYACLLKTMSDLEKHDEPRRKLPTDPRRKVKK